MWEVHSSLTDVWWAMLDKSNFLGSDSWLTLFLLLSLFLFILQILSLKQDSETVHPLPGSYPLLPKMICKEGLKSWSRRRMRGKKNSANRWFSNEARKLKYLLPTVSPNVERLINITWVTKRYAWQWTKVDPTSKHCTMELKHRNEKQTKTLEALLNTCLLYLTKQGNVACTLSLLDAKLWIYTAKKCHKVFSASHFSWMLWKLSRIYLYDMGHSSWCYLLCSAPCLPLVALWRCQYVPDISVCKGGRRHKCAVPACA